MIQTPVDIWLGKRDGAALLLALGGSSSGRWRCSGPARLRRATRVVVQGG